MTDIAALIERLTDPRHADELTMEDTKEAAAALRALAQENERLKARDIEQFATTDQWLSRIHELEAERDQFAEQAAARDSRDHDMQEIMRINNELVAERDDYKSTAVSNSIDRHYTYMEWKERAEKAEAERDAWCHQSELQCRAREAEVGPIRAKTIEECAQVADGWDFGRLIAKEIRALAQTDESKTD